MNSIIVKLSTLTLKEFSRDFVSAFFTIAFPMFFLIVFGSSSSIRGNPAIKLAVLDQANTQISQEYINTLAANDLNNLVFTDLDEAQKQLNNGNLHAIITISHSATSSDSSALNINLLQRGYKNPLVVQTVENSIHELFPSGQAELVINSVTSDVLETKKNSEFAYVMPGILGMALLQLGLFGTATPILSARNRGSMLQLSMTPIRTFDVVVSHVLVRLLLAAIQLGLMLTISMLFFDLTINGSPLLLTLSCALGAFMLISIGFFIGGIAPSMSAGNYIIMFSNMALLFLGNVFFDTSSMGVVDTIAKALPITYLSDANRQIILGTEGRFSLWFDLAVIFVTAIVFTLLASKTFRFSMDARV